MPVENAASSQTASAPPADDFDESVASGVLASGGGDDGGAGAEGQAQPDQSAQTQAPPAPTWRDQAKEFGIDLSSHADDKAAFQHLSDRLKAAEERDRLAQERDQLANLANYGNEFLQYAPEFRSWLAEQQKAKQQQSQAAEADPYARPEFDPRWEAMVEYDDNGVLVPKLAAGGTPEIAAKMRDVLTWRRNFLAEPEKYLESTFKRLAKEQAQTLVEERVAEIRSEHAAQMFMVNNPWLFEKDESGRPKAVLSEEGKVFKGFLDKGKQMGLSGEQQEQFALHSLGLWRQGRGASGNSATQSAQPQQTAQQAQQQAADAAKTDFLKNAAGHGASPAASTVAPLRASDPPQNSNHSLGDMLRSAFASTGIDDATFANL